MHWPYPKPDRMEKDPEAGILAALTILGRNQLHLLETERKEPLWHYTSGQGAIDIIKSGELWATHVACLNDNAEVNAATTLLIEMARQLRIDCDTTEEVTFYDEFLESLEASDLQQQLLESEFYVASLSGEDNDLSQWRAYGGGEGGVALGFDPARLAAPADEWRYMSRVLYEEDERERFSDA